MKLHATLLAWTGMALALGVGGSGAFAKDSGFKIMMTPKWTGFPYFEAAAKGGKPDATELAAIDLNAVAPVLKQSLKRGITVTTFDADAAQDARDLFVNQLSY